MMGWPSAVLLAADASSSGGSGVVITVLSSLLALAVTICLALGIPRLVGQVVPSSRVDEVRSDLQTRISVAEKEAGTWKAAFDGMKSAHDGLLTIQRDTQQAALITNTVMNAMRAQLPPPPTAAAGAVAGGIS